MSAAPFYTRHSGPFALSVRRPFATKPNFFRNEWLTKVTPGEGKEAGEDFTTLVRFEADEVEDLARSLIDDPRDTVVGVSVWSLEEKQFVMAYKKAGA